MKTLPLIVAAWFTLSAAGLAALCLLHWSYRKHADHLTRQRINRLIGEDREVASLDAIWELPAFDRRQAA